MNSVGVPELLIMLMLGGVWLLPVAAVIWALVMLYTIRTEQRAVQVKLDAIERLLRRPS